jgi:hypothetical protein
MLSISQMDINRCGDFDISHAAGSASHPDLVAGHRDAMLDEALEASFPASDPVSSNLFN